MTVTVPNEQRRNELRQRRGAGKDYPILAYDVETDSDGTFVYAHVYGDRYRLQHSKRLIEHVDVGCTSKEALQRAIVGDTIYDAIAHGEPVHRPRNNAVPCVLVAYNYKYDYPYILPVVDDTTVLWGSAGFITGTVRNGAKMIDLTNHTQKRSLAEIIKVMGLEEKGIQKHDLENDPTKRDVRCRDDARATYELGKTLQAFYRAEWDVDLAPTIASQAHRIYTRAYFRYWFNRSGDQCDLNTLERKAYYGGRTECFRRGTHTVHSFDVKSMYPSVMVGNRMPDPNSAKHHTNGARYRPYFNNDEAGIYHVRVSVPKGVVGLLPHHGKEHLEFPWGIFEGWYVKEELQAAEQYGAKILRCYEFIRYTRRLDLFTDYITEMFTRRKRHAAGTLYNLMFKILMNSLYGKFGQKNPVGSFTGKLSDYATAIDEGQVFDIRSVVEGDVCVSHAADRMEEASGAFPCVAAYITALGRVKLLRNLKAHEHTVVYCDTDSVKYLSEEARDPDGHELGEWEYEYTETQVFIRPKVYWKADLTSLKMKGIKMGAMQPLIWDRLPTPAEDKQMYTHGAITAPLERFTVIAFTDDGVLARFYKPTGIKEGIIRKKKVNQWLRHEKLLQWGDTKRTWHQGILFHPDATTVATSTSDAPYHGTDYTASFLTRYQESHQSYTARNTGAGRTDISASPLGRSSSPEQTPVPPAALQSRRWSPPDTCPAISPPSAHIHTDNPGSVVSGYQHWTSAGSSG